MLQSALGLLRRHADDAELIAGFETLRARGFVPVAPARLPSGTPGEVRRALARLTPAERAAVAAGLVALPDPTTAREEARAALELLLTLPAERERAGRYLAKVAPLAEPHEEALLRFRFGADGLANAADAAAWDALLEPLRALSGASPTAHAALSTALHLAASGWLQAQPPATRPLGASWLAPALGGRVLLNAELARARRPALAGALAPLYRWLAEAPRPTSAEPPEGAVERLLGEVAAADRRGELQAGSELLRRAAEAAGDDPALERALAARAALLVDPSLSAADADVAELARRDVPSVAAAPLTPPHRDWSGRLEALAAGAEPEPALLALLEAAGARARAGAAWVARGDLPSLRHALRLLDALEPDARAALEARLRALAGTDEARFPDDPDARDAARGLWLLLADGAERALLRARLAATLPASPASAGTAPPAADPHDPETRLAAASDLLDAGRLDAAATVLAALLRRVEEPAVRARATAFAARLLELDEPPVELLDTATRHIRAWDPTGEALLDTLAAAPRAAYPLHADLIEVATDVSRADAHRVLALAAWLAIWAATGTTPSGESLLHIHRQDWAIVPLAAARVAGDADPVARALAFRARAGRALADPDAFAAFVLEAATPAGG